MKIKVIKSDYDTSFLKELVDESINDYIKDIDSISKVLKNYKLPDFTPIYKQLKQCANITLYTNVLDITSYNLISTKFDEIQNKKNIVLGQREIIMKYDSKWRRVYVCIQRLYEREKNKLFLTSDVRELKNRDSQNAYVDVKLHSLSDIKFKAEFIIDELKAVQEEIKFTLKYLEDAYNSVSRLFTIIQEDNKIEGK